MQLSKYFSQFISHVLILCEGFVDKLKPCIASLQFSWHSVFDCSHMREPRSVVRQPIALKSTLKPIIGKIAKGTSFFIIEEIEASLLWQANL